MNPTFSMRRLWPLCCAALLCGGGMVGHASASDGASSTQSVEAHAHSEVFATVNGQSISSREYEEAFANLVRQKFYHGTVPEGELDKAREEVKNKLVQRIVLLEEAERRGMAPDQKQVDDTLAGYESRYAGSPAWKENRERLLPELRKQLGRQNQLARLEQAVRQVPDPDEAAVRAYYDSHPELFTEPEKLRLSVILLRVDPSSPATTWESTREEAQAIHRRLMAGADFADAARLHSGVKAEEGGDMGYLHKGMLPDGVQERLDGFEVGKINEPIDVLEGVAIFRVDDRVPPKKREFSDVAGRAKDLLVREQQNKAWNDLLDKLVASADIRILSQLGRGQREGGAN